MDDEALFLNKIRANPRDQMLRLVYADWLEERGSGANSEYLRVDVEMQKRITAVAADQLAADPQYRRLRARLSKLSKTLDAEWVAIFAALRPKLYRCRVCGRVLTAREAIDTNPRNYRRMKSTRYCRLCYEDAVRTQLRSGSSGYAGRHSAEQEYHGDTRDDT